MTIAEANDIADVLRKVTSWPAGMRITLARRILETVEADPEMAAPALPRGLSAAEVVAMFKTEKPAPSDEECQRILEEELSRKYGL